VLLGLQACIISHRQVVRHPLSKGFASVYLPEHDPRTEFESASLSHYESGAWKSMKWQVVVASRSSFTMQRPLTFFLVSNVESVEQDSLGNN